MTTMNESETLREICDLIRIPRLDVFKTYDEISDRILAAHEREMAAIVRNLDALEIAVEENCDKETVEKIIAGKRNAQNVMVEKDAEIAKYERCYHSLEVHCKKLEDDYLKATNALKPVMECNEEACRSFGDHYLMLDNAVRDAQRVMREGETE